MPRPFVAALSSVSDMSNTGHKYGLEQHENSQVHHELPGPGALFNASSGHVFCSLFAVGDFEALPDSLY
jgi:hypothetical protein